MTDPTRRIAADQQGTLRDRLEADLAAGKTISLSSDELADPNVRAELPGLLESLAHTRTTRSQTMWHVPGYTLLGEIGHGGMSTVYLARQETLGRHVALKIAPKWLGTDARTQERLLQEARAMARVSHPNIVAIHDIVEVDDTIAIAMEWIDGLTLAGLLRCLPDQPGDDDLAITRAALGTPAEAAEKFEQSSLRFFVRMLHDVARAVHRVHQAGLLHLDIKPSNVLIRRDGTPLLADFGVVREMDLAATHTRTFAGTPVYAAPEQIRRDDARFAAHTDVYALGMTLYEALARFQPLRQLDLTRILLEVEGGRVPRLGSKVRVTDDLANIVHKAIAPEPHHRYATAAAFADDLLAFLEHRPVVARPLSRTQRLRRWTHNEPWKAALAGALLVLVPLLLGVGGYLVAQLPRLEQTRREERQAEAGRLVQRAYLEQLFDLTPLADSIATLREALTLDPSPIRVACALTLAHERRSPELPRLLADFATTIAATPSLEVLAAKIATKVPFFGDEERARLLAMPDPTARYVLALDRFWHGHDRGTEPAAITAERALDEAVLAFPRDLLLNGLHAVTLGWLGAVSALEAAERAVDSRWGDDLTARAWVVAAWMQAKEDRGHERLEDLLSRTAGNSYYPAFACELLARDEPLTFSEKRQVKRPTKLLQRIDRQSALTGGTPSPQQVYQRGLLLGRVQQTDELRTLIARHGATLSAMQRQRLETSLDLQRLGAHVDAVLATSADDPEQLRQLHRWLLQINQGPAAESLPQLTGLIDAVFAAWEHHHPGRRSLYVEQLAWLMTTNRLERALRLAPRCEFPRFAFAHNYVGLAACKVMVADWQGIVDHAQLWFQHAAVGYQRQEAASYLGLAHARLGEHLQAAEYLALALAARPEPGRAKWFAYALIEDAWLRVAPGMPESLHAPGLAAERLAVFDEHNVSLKLEVAGPWTQLVRAEVRYANGDAKGALELLSTTKNAAPEHHQPQNLSQLRVDARQRYKR